MSLIKQAAMYSCHRFALPAILLMHAMSLFAQQSNIQANKSFHPVQIQNIAPFNVSKLSLQIINNQPAVTLSNFNLTDNLPSGINVANPGNISDACAAKLNAKPGASFVTVIGGKAQFGDICTFTVDVVSTSGKIYTNMIPAGSPLSVGKTVPEDTRASLTVLNQSVTPAYVAQKIFNPSTVLDGQTSQMTITLANDNLFDLPATNITDNLPVGMSVASPNHAATTCTGGVITATSGTSVVKLNGTTILTHKPCTLTVDVIARNTGASTINLHNLIRPGDVQSFVAHPTVKPLFNRGTTAGTLVVKPMPSQLITKSFSNVTPHVGQFFTLMLTFFNNTPNALSNIKITDKLPWPLSVYTTNPNSKTTCAGGNVSAPGGATAVVLTGAMLLPNQLCTVTVNVVGAHDNGGIPVTNTIFANTLQANDQTIMHPPALATVTLQNVPSGQGPSLGPITKVFEQRIREVALGGLIPSPHHPAMTVGGTIDMVVTLNKTLPAGGIDNDLQPIHFLDNWSSIAPFLSITAVVSNTCGGTLIAKTGSQQMELNGGVIGQGSTHCDIKLRVQANTTMPIPGPTGTPQHNEVIACLNGTIGKPCATGPSAQADALIVRPLPLRPIKTFNLKQAALTQPITASVTVENSAFTPSPSDPSKGLPRFNVTTVDTLPPELKFATPLNATMSCTNDAGNPNPTFTISGKTLTFTIPKLNSFTTSATPPACTIRFDLIADSQGGAVLNGSATNTINAGDVTAQTQTGQPDATATNVAPAHVTVNFIEASLPPKIAKSFSPITIFKKEDLAMPINKNVSNTGISELTTLTLKIINPNTKSRDKFTSTSLSDTLPAGLMFAPASNLNLGMSGCAEGIASISGTTLNASKLTILSGSTCIIRVNVIGKIKGNQVNTIASNAVQTQLGVSNDLPASATVTVLGTTPLSALFMDVTRTGSNTSIHGQTIAGGDLLTYTLTLSNPGYLPLPLSTGVMRVQDVLPAGVSFVSTVGSAYPGILSDNKVIWDLSGSTQVLQRNESITLMLNVRVKPNPLLPIANTATVGLHSVISNCSKVYDVDGMCTFTPPHAQCTMPANLVQPSAQDLINLNMCHPVTVLPPQVKAYVNDLALTKSGPTAFTLAHTGEYALSITNTGVVDTSTPLQLLEHLPPGMHLNGNITSPDGTISHVVMAGTPDTGLNITFDYLPSQRLAPKGSPGIITVPVMVSTNAAIGSVTNYASVGGGFPNSTPPPATGPNCTAQSCTNFTSQIRTGGNLLSVSKEVSFFASPSSGANSSTTHLSTTTVTAEIGDVVVYTITVKNISDVEVFNPEIIDTLPQGFHLVEGSVMVNGATLISQSGGIGPTITQTLFSLVPGQLATIVYRARLGVGSMQGDGVNIVYAKCPNNASVNCSHTARAKVKVTGGVFMNAACVVGMIYVDCNHNQMNDEEELGIPGVRLYFEDGTYLISDSEGKYSFCGLSPKTHVLKVDHHTLPRESRLIVSSNRNVGDAGSLFVDLTHGELQRADFIEGACSNKVLEQVKARRTQGEIWAPEMEKPSLSPLTFEAKAPDYPQEGTDSADQRIVKPRVSGDIRPIRPTSARGE